MMALLRSATVLAGLLLPTYAHGNGITASFPAGGVEFKSSTHIAIQQEDLFLSPAEIRVDYVFHSIAEQPSTEVIAFPLPRVPSIPDSPEAVQDLGRGSGDMRNYLDFGVAVNGRPVIPVLHEFAWLEDKEVSAEILAAGLPLLPSYNDWVDAVAKLDPETFDSLVASGLLWDYGGGDASPAWDYQVIYEWEQVFAPGETSATIRYRPLIGWPGDYGVSAYDTGELAEAACVDDALRQQIAEFKRTYGPYQVGQLGYITTTARLWSGPIGQFNLTVGTDEPEEWAEGPTLIAVCPAGTSMDEEGNRHWAVSNYVPDQDIHVTYYFFSEN